MYCRILRGLLATAAIGACADAGLAPVSEERATPSATSIGAMARDERSVFITYRPGAPAGRAAAIRALGVASAHDVEDERTIAAVMPEAMVDALRRIPWIADIEVSDAEPLRVTDDMVTWGMDSIGALEVHATPGYRGAGVRVAVLDTRVACDHGDLRDRIAGGYDFVDGTSMICVTGYYGFPSHGTGVAGIIAGSRNGSGIIGVAPEAALYAVRVCDDAGECQAANIWAGLLWARKAGAQVVNLSLGNCGGELDWRIADALRRLIESRIVVIAAAGNGPPACPAGSPVSSMARAAGVVGVAHWLRDGTQNPSYQYGAGVDLSAPVQVPLADPGFGVNTNLSQGTSFAAPHVSGAAALLVQAGFPGDLIPRRLMETAMDRGPAGWDDHWGAGTLHAAHAAVSRPFVAAFEGVDGPVASAGSHTITARIVNGVAPIAVTWAVSYSDPAVHGSYTTTGGDSHTLDIPSGAYSITVKATPKELVYARIGLTSVATVLVCTDGGGVDPLARVPGTDGPAAFSTTARAGPC